MKVAIINYTCGYGSTGKNIIKTYKRFINLGYEARVYYGEKHKDNDNLDNEDFIFFGNKINYYVSHKVQKGNDSSFMC